MADNQAQPKNGPAIPLARWAGRQLQALAEEAGSHAIAELSGQTVVGERARWGDYIITDIVSPGIGSSRLLPTADGKWFTITLPRQADREMLPALFQNADFDIFDDQAIARAVASRPCDDLLNLGRLLGLAVAAVDETPVSAPVTLITQGPARDRKPASPPLVIDLSAIWAGPLTGHLLWLAGANVVKVESTGRPDMMRSLDPGIYDLMNQGKAQVATDFADEACVAALTDLIRRADIVIESSRPRALYQLGIDADALVRETPGLVWLSITGHGATGETANWIGFGPDCGVAGGVTRAYAEATGRIGFVGDAITDPLTGITAALEGWRAYRNGTACRLGFAMSAIAARALHEERQYDTVALEREFHAWADATGLPFPAVEKRKLHGTVSAFGEDTEAWLGIPDRR